MNFLLIISAFWILSEIVLARILRNKDTGADYDRSSLKILWLTISFSIVTGILFRPAAFVISPEKGIFFYNTGVSLICLGFFIRWIAILKLKKSFTVNVTVSENQVIIQDGIYKYIRHPSYTGSLLSFLGLAIVFNNWLSLVIIFVPILSAFLYRIRVEENILIKSFGKQYTDYVVRSRKLIPGIY